MAKRLSGSVKQGFLRKEVGVQGDGKPPVHRYTGTKSPGDAKIQKKPMTGSGKMK